MVDDGSTDRTPSIASEFDCRVITIPHGGLSNARNVGWQAATGEIIVYLDDDAMPTRHWLQFLAHAFVHSEHAAIGGPNLQPHGIGGVADCVDNAPGAPVHVLLTDEIAEHLPGCNLAVRRHCLEAIGGFDARFHVAGDDVDVCWRLQDRGWTLGFSHGAMVWHHRRRRIVDYWKQQVGYGRAEASLAAKWPDKYDSGRGPTFFGRLYGKGLAHALFRVQHVYYGSGGFAPFQSVYESSPGTWASLPLMPEWYLILLAFAGLTVLGSLWPLLYLALIPLVIGVAVTVSHAVVASLEAEFVTPPSSRWQLGWRRVLTAWLHVLQPAARLWGRFRTAPQKRRGVCEGRFRWPHPQSTAWWSPDWIAPERRYQELDCALRDRGARVRRGGVFERWDFEVEGGRFGGARLLLGIEDHGAGAQYIRMRTWPRWRLGSRCLVLLAIPVLFAAVAGGTFVAAIVGGMWLLTIGLITLVQSGRTMGLMHEVFATYTVACRSSTPLGAHAEGGDPSGDMAQS